MPTIPQKIKYGLFNIKDIYGKDTPLKTSDDIFFIQKAKEAGFQPYCYTKVKCEHLINGKFNGEMHPAYKN